MVRYWEHFREILCSSIIGIGQCYFEVKRKNELAVQRERVYCYELYHQLRQNLGDDFRYTLHAEIDKRGQQIVWKRVGNYTNPDFVVHIPGAGLGKEFQLVVMEVKASSRLDAENLKQDIDKLRVYIEEVEYYKGAFLVFGTQNHHSSVLELIENTDVPDNVSIFWHDEIGRPPKIFGVD